MTDDKFQDRGIVETIVRGLWRRVAATVALLTGGLVFVILYLGFLAVRLPWYENLSVVLTTVVLVPVLVLGIWVAYFGRLVRRASRIHGLEFHFE